MKAWLSGSVLLAVMGAGTVAGAREQFPRVIAQRLVAPRLPSCSICHLGGKTSGATVATLFAWTMRAHGMSGSQSSVDTAIQGVAADHVDSDGDGVTDAQEIVDGTDPNTPGTATDFTDPQLGCRIASGRSGWGSAAGLALAAAWFIRRRRR